MEAILRRPRIEAIMRKPESLGRGRSRPGAARRHPEVGESLWEDMCKS